MASVVQICNMALSHIGSDTRVASISPPDGSLEAGHCATFYDPSRAEMLEVGSWPFALARQTLSETVNLSENWAYAYAKPSDCLSPRRVLTIGAGLTVFNQDMNVLPIDDSDSADFTVEGDVIYTNEANATLLYVRDVTDPNKMTPSFISALSFLLAGYLAGPIVRGNEGAKLADSMRTRALAAAETAATASANASRATTAPTSSILAVRS